MFDKKLYTETAVSRKKRDIVYSNLSWNMQKKMHFSGASPPEIFVGRYNYPNVQAGILSPDSFHNTEELSLPEIWHEKKFSIHDILLRRGTLVYGKVNLNIKNTHTSKNFLRVMQELSMSHQSVSTEFFLKKPPHMQMNRISPIIANPAPLQYARLQENPKVMPKVDYLVSDADTKSTDSIGELYTAHVKVSNIIKLLSAGLLGLKTQRKLVPTRWSITAVDETLSKQLLKSIRTYKEINEILLFNAEYNGNHYEIILLPDTFSFEVIEAETNADPIVKFWQDYELFQPRKKYAENVVGAYYANRLALCEYLTKIKKQATAIFFREIRPEYFAPLGVGILRECTRDAFKKIPEKCATLKEAFEHAQLRLRIPIKEFTEKSVLLQEHGKQKKLWEF